VRVTWTPRRIRRSAKGEVWGDRRFSITGKDYSWKTGMAVTTQTKNSRERTGRSQ
jgi:hypothetical protein